MTQQTKIKIFEESQVRTLWDSEQEEWYFSIIDVIQVLTESVDARKYWNKAKQRLKEEGNETVTNCHQLKMPAADGNVAKAARLQLEESTGKSAISPLNAKDIARGIEAPQE